MNTSHCVRSCQRGWKGGEIILQKSVPVHSGDTPEMLQKRVMTRAEWVILPRAAELISKKIQKEGKRYGV